jgi:hypothetical protein
LKRWLLGVTPNVSQGNWPVMLGYEGALLSIVFAPRPFSVKG